MTMPDPDDEDADDQREPGPSLTLCFDSFATVAMISMPDGGEHAEATVQHANGKAQHPEADSAHGGEDDDATVRQANGEARLQMMPPTTILTTMPDDATDDRRGEEKDAAYMALRQALLAATDADNDVVDMAILALRQALRDAFNDTANSASLSLKAFYRFATVFFPNCEDDAASLALQAFRRFTTLLLMMFPEDATDVNNDADDTNQPSDTLSSGGDDDVSCNAPLESTASLFADAASIPYENALSLISNDLKACYDKIDNPRLTINNTAVTAGKTFASISTDASLSWERDNGSFMVVSIAPPDAPSFCGGDNASFGPAFPIAPTLSCRRDNFASFGKAVASRHLAALLLIASKHFS